MIKIADDLQRRTYGWTHLAFGLTYAHDASDQGILFLGSFVVLRKVAKKHNHQRQISVRRHETMQGQATSEADQRTLDQKQDQECAARQNRFPKSPAISCGQN